MPKLFQSTIDEFEVILPDDVVGDPVRQREFVLAARAQRAQYASGSAPMITSDQPQLGQTMTGSRGNVTINPADTRDATAFEEGFNYTVMNPVVGAGQRIREVLDRTPIPSPNFLPTQEQVTARRERYENSGLSKMPGAATGRFAGSMVSSAPLLAATRSPNVLVGSGLFGGIQPTTEGESPLLNATISTAAGGTGLALGGLLGYLARGGRSPRAQMLMDEGINLTPGQASGPSASMIEESINVPFAGIEKARNRAVEQFNTASINRALQPINETLSEGVAAGYSAIDDAATKIGKVYEDAYENIGDLRVDQQWSDAYQAILADVTDSGFKDARRKFRREAGSKITDNLKDSRRTFPGKAWTETQKEFRDKGRNLLRSDTPRSESQQASAEVLADAYSRLSLEMGNMVARQKPKVAEQVSAANRAYRMFIPIKNASLTAGSAARAGVFTPNVLNTAIKNNARNAFARGNAPMQNFSQAGVEVLGNRLNNSGTALRQIGQTLPSLLAGGALFNSSAILPAAVGLGLTRAAYTPTGTRVMNTLLNRRPEAMQGFQLNPVLTGATGVATGQGLFGR
tara:strand:- start:9780 stop:11498 length:1719 start_codon:yes stop_codon:yes gene_type:complete